MTLPQLIHYTPEYVSFLKNLLNCEDETIWGHPGTENQTILPLLTRDGPLGRVANSLPFFGSHGGPFAVDSLKLNKSELLFDLENRIRSECYSSVTVVENPFSPLSDSEISSLSFLQEVDSRVSQVTHWVKEDSPSDDSLMEMFHPKTRNAIRKGLKRCGDITDSSEDAEVFDFLVQEHRLSIERLLGQPKERFVFERLRTDLSDYFRIYAARTNEGELVSALLLLEFGETIEYFTPVIKYEYRESQILSALIYTIMLQKFQDNFRYWNWGGTWKSQLGVYRFKNRFGATDREYRYFNWCDEKVSEASTSELLNEYPYWFTRKF